MSSPLKRLETIISNIRPSTCTMHATLGNDGRSVNFTPVRIEPFHLLPNPDPLQDLLKGNLQETWDSDRHQYVASANLDQLFRVIKNDIIVEYNRHSTRCAATKRKTEHFIQGIKLGDQHLANFLLQMFIEVHSAGYEAKTREARRIYFETLESLRRVYGKR